MSKRENVWSPNNVFIAKHFPFEQGFREGPEGVKWELGFGQIFTGKVGFGSLGLGFGHWEWES